MKKSLKAMALTGVVVLALSGTLAGCGASKNGSSGGNMPNTEVKKDVIDTSKPVTLKMYMPINSEQPLWPDVLAKVNEIIKKEVNATLDVEFIKDKNKIPMILASGEEYDMMSIYNMTYVTEAAKGPFKEITQDMINKYMPRYSKVVTKDQLKQSLVNGKMYVLPQTKGDLNLSMLYIRKDLREKYNIPEIKKFSELEQFFDKLAKNEPGVIGYNPNKDLSNYLFNSLFAEYLGMDVRGVGGTLYYQTESEDGKLYSLFDEPLFTAYKKAAVKIKEWYDKGYLAKNPFSNTAGNDVSFTQGKTAVAYAYLYRMPLLKDTLSGNGMKLEALQNNTLNVSEKGRMVLPKTTQFGVVISVNSKNAERALMAADHFYENPDVIRMLEYGFEGKTYVVNKDGKVEMPAGVTPSNTPYVWGQTGFWMGDSDFKYARAEWDDYFLSFYNKAQKAGYAPNAYVAYQPDFSALLTEVANIKQVTDLERKAIEYGMVDNVDQALDLFKKKMKDAGADKIDAAVRQQTQQYLSNK